MPLDAITIRPAVMQDRETLCRVYHEFHQFHVRGVPDRLLSLGEPPESYEGTDLFEALAGLIENEDVAFLVADVAGQLVGLAEIYIRQDEPNPFKAAFRHGYLQSLMVKHGFRRQGVGTRLQEAAQQWAKGKGAEEMRLETWEFDEGPQRFYEKRGYRTIRRTLIREI